MGQGRSLKCVQDQSKAGQSGVVAGYEASHLNYADA